MAGNNDVGDVISVQIGIDLYEEYGPEELTSAIIRDAVIDAIPQYEEANASQLRTP